MYRSNTYIKDGRVVRGNQVKKSIIWKRFWTLLSIVSFLGLTNLKTLNDFGVLQTAEPSKKPFPSFSSISKPAITNYGILSLEEKTHSVVIHAALLTATCPFNNDEIGLVCVEIATRFSNEKPLILDRWDRVHTVHRTLCAWVIALSCLFFCFDGCPFSYRFLDNPICGALLSLCYQPNILIDVMALTTFVRPALYDLNRMGSRLSRQSCLLLFEDADSNFVFLVFVLVVIIGGVSNLVASKLSGRTVVGMSSVVAASLAYSSQINMNRAAVFYLIDQPVSSASAYWSLFIMNILHHASAGKDPIPSIATWMIAGWAGSIFARYQLSNQLWWGDALHFVGLF